MEPMVRVETVLGSWKTARSDTAQAVEDFPANELDFKPTPDVASFREIVHHILDASHALTGLLLDGVENLAVPEFRQMLMKYVPVAPKDADRARLAAELRSALDLRCTQLARQPPEFFSKIVTRFDGQQVTCLEMLQFVKEHELCHRAQLFLYLRLKGIVPVTTRRRQLKK